jgi:hypothetical protein
MQAIFLWSLSVCRCWLRCDCVVAVGDSLRLRSRNGCQPLEIREREREQSTPSLSSRAARRYEKLGALSSFGMLTRPATVRSGSTRRSVPQSSRATRGCASTARDVSRLAKSIFGSLIDIVARRSIPSLSCRRGCPNPPFARLLGLAKLAE